MQAAAVEIKEAGGKLFVLAIGRTTRGQRYIKDAKAISVQSMRDKKFKTEMAQAVKELLESEA